MILRAARVLALVALPLTVDVVYAAESGPLTCDLTLAPIDQAHCLLGARELPRPLEQMIGTPTAIPRAALLAAFRRAKVSEADIGGSLDEPLSKTAAGDSARYFLIHDTSYPVFPAGTRFPAAINGDAWNREWLRKLVTADRQREYGAHVYIDRRGRVAISRDMGVPRLSSKAERLLPDLVGLFIAVECIQPRRRDERGRDIHVPDPAFTGAQLDTLALAYIVASHRAGNWLIPAYHWRLDAGIPGAHDDPRGFDLRQWSGRVERWTRQMSKATPRRL